MLIVDGAPLSQGAAELNRYIRRQLVIDDPVTGAVWIGGTFRVSNPDAFAEGQWRPWASRF
jgi:transmembrane sensor